MLDHFRGRPTAGRCAIGTSVGSVILFGTIAGAALGPCDEETVPFLLEGDPAPGTPDEFQTFDRPNVSAVGAILFAADTNGPTGADDVLYLGDVLVAREGDPAPGVVGGTFGPFEFFETQHQVNIAGDVAFIATLRDVPGATDRAVYRNGTLIARSGSAPAIIPDRLYSDFGFAGVTDGGVVGFLADLDGATGSDSVIFYGGAILFREGDAVPSLPEETWDGNFGEVQWNGRGDVLFAGNTSLPTSGDVVLFRQMNDPEIGPIPEIVAQEGQSVETPLGPDFLDTIAQTSLAEDGGWALRGTLRLASSDADGVILSEAGFTRQEGDDVPELPGVVLGGFTALAVNASGDVAYVADLVGPTPPEVDEGLFVNDCLLLTNGAPAPGLPEGVMLVDIGFEDVVINDERVVVFTASYDGPVSGDGLFRLTLDGSPPCPADLDGSGDVGFDDLWALLAVWGPCAGCTEDLDGNGDVNFEDMLQLLSAWGVCP